MSLHYVWCFGSKFCSQFAERPNYPTNKNFEKWVKLVKNSQIKLKSCIQVDFDLWNHLLLFRCEWNVCKVPRSGLIFYEKRAKLVKIWKSEISGFRLHQRDSFTSKTIILHIFCDLESIFGHFELFLAKNGLK